VDVDVAEVLGMVLKQVDLEDDAVLVELHGGTWRWNAS
jgi:hypothetical protein